MPYDILSPIIPPNYARWPQQLIYEQLLFSCFFEQFLSSIIFAQLQLSIIYEQLLFAGQRKERPGRLDPVTMNGTEEGNAEYEFTRKISNSFAESIMASSPTKVTTNNHSHIYSFSPMSRPTERWEMGATLGRANRWRRNKSTSSKAACKTATSLGRSRRSTWTTSPPTWRATTRLSSRWTRTCLSTLLFFSAPVVR